MIREMWPPHCIVTHINVPNGIISLDVVLASCCFYVATISDHLVLYDTYLVLFYLKDM